MKFIKTPAFLILTFLLTFSAAAQDIVVISDGNFLKGTIKGTNFSSVILEEDEGSFKEFFAKDIKEFNWNGETYVSMPIVVKKSMESRFFKLVAYGAVNLYSIGGKTAAVAMPAPKRSRVRPNVGVGMGTGGMGSGVGGGISIDLGGRRSQEETPTQQVPATYFIQKIGSPMQQVPLNTNPADPTDTTPQVKALLLQKLTDSEDLKQKISTAERIDEKELISLIKEYNKAKE